MLRISTTTLESYRLWRDGDWMDEADLQATIRGEFVPTAAVLAGQAFGRALERPLKYKVEGGYRIPSPAEGVPDYMIDDDVFAPCLALMDHSLGVFEVKSQKVYLGDCNVVAVADQIVGNHLIEHKTTSNFDVEKYASSCQWRFMTDIFQTTRCTYHVFVVDDHQNGVLTVKGIESFHLYPYPELHQDCEELVRDFRYYVTMRGLDGLLRERQQAA
jgi:hypothetical protein